MKLIPREVAEAWESETYIGFQTQLWRLALRIANLFHIKQRSKLWAWLWEHELRSSVRDFGGKVVFWRNGTWQP